MNLPTDHSPSPTNATPDALRAWTLRQQASFDSLEPSADRWAAIERQLPAAPDALHTWAIHHRPAFDTVEPRADLWAAIEQKLAPVEVAAAPAAIPHLTASRGAAQPRTTSRPAWWQMAAAAVVVFGLGYGLRVGTEPAASPSAVVLNDEQPAAVEFAEPVDPATNLHVASLRHGFHNQEPDPAVQATRLASNVVAEPEPVVAVPARRATSSAGLAPEISRLEARYAALVARQRAGTRHRFVGAHALADEWDREMSVLDSAYVALRQELPRSRRPDEVVAAMSRNLHLRLRLLQQQMMALDAVQEVRQRTGGRIVPTRPPSVNPEDNGINLEDVLPSRGGTLVPPAPPAPALPGLGAHVAPRPRLTV